MIESDGGLVLSPPDRDLLRELIAWYRGQRHDTPRTHVPPTLPQSPDVYLARTAAGIPAMTIEAGTGTDSSVGVISKADCSLYRIDDRDPNIDIDPIGVQRPVYNPSLVEVPANTPFLAVRTKDGKFVAVQLGGGGTGGDVVRFSQPANDNATPPKPKLESHAEVDYNLASDTVNLTGTKYWARDMNK